MPKIKKSKLAELEKLGLSVNSLLAVLAVGATCFLIGMEYQKSKTVVSADTSTQASTSQIAMPAPTTTSSTTSTSTDASSTSDTSSSTSTSAIVDINTGTLAELDTLPGIGPKYAQAIIDYRTANGPFVRAADIVNVKGIGPKTYDKLKDRITI
ncbi:MAG TPA: helix-hairpin-helix domain-containing protein [Candidatus Saccharimonadales bacterium]|nr:helix-hairpin-helix domain-containing protein [Candidatus Saccharimonadales bacterium]